MGTFSMHSRRMGSRVDLFQLTDAHLRVDLRGREVGVAQHLLDVADVRSILQHQRGHGVAKEMAGSLLGDVGGVDVVAGELGQSVGAEGLAVVGEKQVALVGLDDIRRPHLVGILLGPCNGPVADGDHAILLALALPYQQGAPVHVQVVAVEADELHAPHARGVEHLEDGPIPDAQGIADIRLHHHLLGFG